MGIRVVLRAANGGLVDVHSDDDTLDDVMTSARSALKFIMLPEPAKLHPMDLPINEYPVIRPEPMRDRAPQPVHVQPQPQPQQVTQPINRMNYATPLAQTSGAETVVFDTSALRTGAHSR